MPWAFTKLLKQVEAYLRRQGKRVIIYLDDILVISFSEKDAKGEFSIIKSFLESLEFLINHDKSVSTP